MEYCQKSDAQTFIVVTEAGILFELQRRCPEKRFIPAPPASPAVGCGCNECAYMKMVTLEKIVSALENEQPEIVLDEEVRKSAERSIRNMIAIK